MPEVGVPPGTSVDDAQHQAQREERTGPSASGPPQHRHGVRDRGGPGAPQPRVHEPPQYDQGHGRRAVLDDLEHRVAADAPAEDGDQLGAPPALVGEGVPHDMGARPDDGGQDEPHRLGRDEPARLTAPAPYETVHPPPHSPRQQRHEGFAQHQPQRHQGPGDEDIHGEHSPHGMCHLAELHGSRHDRVRVVGDVRRERPGDQRRGDERPTARPGPADSRKHGGGMAECERHGGKYARGRATRPTALSR